MSGLQQSSGIPSLVPESWSMDCPWCRHGTPDLGPRRVGRGTGTVCGIVGSRGHERRPWDPDAVTLVDWPVSSWHATV